MDDTREVFVGIIGTRRRDSIADYLLVLDAFHKVKGQYDDRAIVIVSGGCPEGGDRFAEMIAWNYKLRPVIHYPDRSAFLDTPEPWRSTKQNYARNRLVAEDARDHLIACVSEDRTGGTEHTIKVYKQIHHREPILV